jgi:hypothetical protein
MWRSAVGVAGVVILLWACSNAADDVRIGAECTAADGGSCENEDLTCLTQFRGGYCGSEGCTSNADCVAGSICVAHEGANYCFRTCLEKAECNTHRTVENESNCSSNIVRVDADAGTVKACVPPASGV